VLLFVSLSVSAQRPYPAPCSFALQRPGPAQSEPFIASGFVDLVAFTTTSQPRSHAYRAYRKACPGGGAVAIITLDPIGIPDGLRPRISIV